MVFTVRGLVHRSTEISSEIEIKIRIQDLGHVFTDMDARKNHSNITPLLLTAVCLVQFITFIGITLIENNKREVLYKKLEIRRQAIVNISANCIIIQKVSDHEYFIFSLGFKIFQGSGAVLVKKKGGFYVIFRQYWSTCNTNF